MEKNLIDGDTMKKKQISLLSLFLIPMILLGQIKKEVPIPISVEEMIQIPVERNMSLGLKWFDAEKFTMSHSYEMSVGTFGKDPYSTGMYLNHMNYAYSERLNLKAVVGFTHDPLHLSNNLPNQGFDMNNIVYGAEVAYKPTENSVFKFSFEKVPYTYGYGYNPYYSPYGYSNYYRRPSILNNNDTYYGF
jgi:hypothetical protein